MITRGSPVGHANARPPPGRGHLVRRKCISSTRSESLCTGGRPPSLPEEGPRSMTTATHRPATRAQMELPGQRHVAEGPLDLTGMYMAHHAFRRDLARFAVAARQTPVDAADVWSALVI